MKAKYVSADKDLVFRVAMRLYENEIDKITAGFYRNACPGKIWWEKWDKEKFEKRLTRHIMKKFEIDINIGEVYEKVLEGHTRLYVQQDFMKEPYGYTYSCGKGPFKDYGNVIFYAKPDCDGKYDFKEFLDYWAYSVLSHKHAKWAKNAGRHKEKFSQRWSTLYDVIHHYDHTVSREQAKEMLDECLVARKIYAREITDYEIIF